ncbi:MULTISPECIES: hypothetical protein [Olivibacter]|uniref:Uncharacterized protein n=1 Tax=Olivibacter jilunii TaxID=985016 RepID=A0ABW6B2V5_9SPHI
MKKKEPITDLELFEKLFAPETPRKTTGKLEYRVRDLDGAKINTLHIIKTKKLNLEIVSIGNMPTMRSFFVQPIG